GSAASSATTSRCSPSPACTTTSCGAGRTYSGVAGKFPGRSPPGRALMLRKPIFCAHPTTGVTTALVILMMSATGVLLTYERQMLGWAERQLVSEPGAARRLGVAELLQAARRQEPAFAPTSVTLSAHPRAPVVLSAGRGNTRLVDP